MTPRRFPAALPLLALLLCLGVPVRAADGSAGFTADAQLPANQLDPDASHFDLRVEPGGTQQLAVRVHNLEEDPITVTVETIAASTDREGNLHYSSPGIYDESMRHPFSRLAVPREPELTVPAGGMADAVVTLTLPEEAIPGTVLGAIRIIRLPGEAELEGTGIVNRYGYTIGVRLTQREEEIRPEFALGSVGAQLINHKAAIVAEIRNTRPAIARGLAVRTRVYQAGSDTPVIEREQRDVNIAPNAVFPMSLIDREGYGFPEGEYRAVVDLEYDGQHQAFTDAFTVVAETADRVNGGAVNQQQNQRRPEASPDAIPYLPMTIALLLAAGTVLVTGRLLRRRRQSR